MLLRCLFAVLVGVTSAVSAQTERPAVIKNIHFSSEVERIGHGDNWHITWAADDLQYTCWGDGRGFAPAASPTLNNGVAVISGDPVEHRGSNLIGYPVIAESVQHWYSYGILAVDKTLYQFVSYLEHGSDRIAESTRPTHFVGTRLVWSNDQGKTWKMGDGRPLEWDAPSSENMTFWREPNDTFSLISVLQQGRDYSQNRDGYVYLYAPNGSDERMRELVLARVSKKNLRDQAAYEFFSNLDGKGHPVWSPEIGHRAPVHRFREGWVASTLAYSWHPFVIYNEPLGHYLMVASGNGRDGSVTFSKPSCLGIYAASRPWGPWTEVYWNETWTGDDAGNRANSSPKVAECRRQIDDLGVLGFEGRLHEKLQTESPTDQVVDRVAIAMSHKTRHVNLRSQVISPEITRMRNT